MKIQSHLCEGNRCIAKSRQSSVLHPAKVIYPERIYFAASLLLKDEVLYEPFE